MQVGKLTHEQRLRLKQDGRPCSDVKVKSRLCGAVYRSFLWICGYSEKIHTSAGHVYSWEIIQS